MIRLVRRVGRLGALVAAVILAIAAEAAADPVERLVVIKADGLSQSLVDRAVRERNPRTGRSYLPWIDHVFYQGGTRLSNFYVRGMSLSGPSWSMLDTGQHLQIRSNIEFDRYTQRPYDYLNFFPFWFNYVQRRVGDMLGTAVLDDIGVRLLLDAYDVDERHQSFQLYQRGARLLTLGSALQNRVTSRTPRQLFDEWHVGIDGRAILNEQLEREVIAGLGDPRIRYLDYYSTEFDHNGHHNRDWPTQRATLQQLDALVGRIWTAIGQTPQAASTALILLSDHGFNTDERVYSQGYSLVNLLGSREGGGHHIVTKRRLMQDYAIKSIYPLVPLITTASNESLYLKDLADYPTALVDFDGNERASIHLRSSTLNTLHILLLQIQRDDLDPALRQAAIDAFLALRDRHRPEWQATLVEMREEVAALVRAADVLRARLASLTPAEDAEPVVETPAQVQERLRLVGRVERGTVEAVEYTAYLDTLARLLAVTRGSLPQAAARPEFLIPAGGMGDRNALFDLQHYVAGPAPGGLTLAPDGSLDVERSFTRLDYLALLLGVTVRNNVQPGLSNRPIDFTAVHVPCGSVAALDAAPAERPEFCLWLNGGAGAEAMLLARHDASGRLWLRYDPVSGVAQDAGGSVRLERATWRAGLPLRIWEDARLDLPGGVSRLAWLDEWHTDDEWLRATHRTAYSNAVVGLHEQLAPRTAPSLADGEPGLSEDERVMRRLRRRQRALVEPDILMLASDHWNFDVRGFNPGGNHGSFFRASTHSTLMLAGGERTGIPRGMDVRAPYDSLSFMPTILTLTGELDANGQPSPALRERGFLPFPGPVVRELFERAEPLASAD